jgi:hypothetical protein
VRDSDIEYSGHGLSARGLDLISDSACGRLVETQSAHFELAAGLQGPVAPITAISFSLLDDMFIPCFILCPFYFFSLLNGQRASATSIALSISLR